KHRIYQGIWDPKAAQRGPKSTDDHGLGLTARDDETADRHVISCANVHASRNVNEPARACRRRGRWRGRRGWCRRNRSARHELRARNIIICKRLTVACDRVHDRVHMLTMFVRVIETERVAEFVQEDAP